MAASSPRALGRPDPEAPTGGRAKQRVTATWEGESRQLGALSFLHPPKRVRPHRRPGGNGPREPRQGGTKPLADWEGTKRGLQRPLKDRRTPNLGKLKNSGLESRLNKQPGARPGAAAGLGSWRPLLAVPSEATQAGS